MKERHFLHIRIHDLAAYYEVGWTLCASSESIGYLVVEWLNKRPAVVPYERVSEVYAQWDRWRVRGRSGVSNHQQSIPAFQIQTSAPITAEELSR